MRVGDLGSVTQLSAEELMQRAACIDPEKFGRLADKLEAKSVKGGIKFDVHYSYRADSKDRYQINVVDDRGNVITSVTIWGNYEEIEDAEKKLH